MDIHDKTKEQLIANLQLLEEQNSKLKSQLDGINLSEMVTETDKNTDLVDFNYFELIFNTSPDIAIISRLSDSKVIKVNDGFSKITGYTREEALNGTRFTINLWQNPDDRQLLLNEIQKHGAFENIETTMVRKNGTAFRSLVSARLFELDGEKYVSSISRDINDLKNAEELLRKSENEIQNKFATLNSIFESSQNIIIFSLDVNYCYTAFTTLHKQTMKLIWGVDIAVGMNMLELIQDPTDRKKAKDNFDQVLKGDHLRFEEEYGDSTLHRAYYEDIYNPIIDNKGVIVGLSVFVIDITDRKNAEHKNERNQKLLEESQQIGKIGGWELDIDSMELFWTSEMYAIHEVDATFNPMLDKRQHFFTPESLIAIDDAVKRTIKLGEPYDIDVEIITAKGNRKNIKTIGKLDLDSRRVVGYFQDITEKKLAEQEKKASDELFKHVFDYSNVGKSITTPEGIATTNKAFRDLLGYQFAEMQNINWSEITHPDDIELNERYINLMKTGEMDQVRFSKRFIHKNGSIIWVDLSSSAMRNNKGELQYLITTILDITEQKLTEQALKESEEKYRYIVDNAIEGIYRTSIDGKALMANSALATMLGYASPEEYLREMNDAAHQVWFSPEQRDEYISLLEKQDIIKGYECQMKKKDGTPVWVSTNAKIVRDEAGNKIYSEGFTEEITNRKKIETELKHQNQLFDSLINNLSIGVFMVESPTGKPLIANKSALHLLGRGILPDASKQNLAEVYKAFKNNTNQSYPVDEMPIVRGMYGACSHIDDMIVEKPDGTKTHLEIFGSPVKDDEGNVWASLVSFEDITNRKQAEQALKESEEKYRESQLIGNVAHWEYNFITNELFWSDQLYKIYELSKADFEPDLKKALAAAHIDDQETIRKAYFEAIQNKTEFEIEYRIITPGGDLKHIISRAKPKFDESGNPTTMIGTVVDITERKKIENELKKSQEELRNFSTYLLKVRENERAEITLEIHDSIAQFLVALKVEMGLYLRKMSNGIEVVKTEEVKTKMEQLVSQVDLTLKSARMIMNGLRPDQLDLLGLVEAIEVHLHNFEEIHHIKCNFENTISELMIQKEQSIVLFRILQESLTNILKHAKANSVTVKLTEIDRNLILEVIDNGVGFDEKCISQPDSYGLISMKEQVKGLDGIFTIASQLGNGTLVRVEIPHKE